MTTTTISDEQKKNATKVSESLSLFRSCFQQWSNLVSVRRRTIGWNYDLEKNDPPGIPDLGLRERLARLGTELLPDLNGYTGEPAISQGALKEIIYLCESARDNALVISPQPGKYLGPAFEVLEADLRSLSGSATADEVKESHHAKPMLTIHATDMTATLGTRQTKFKHGTLWQKFKKMAQHPGTTVAISAGQAGRLREILKPNLPEVATIEAIYCVHKGRYAICTNDFLVEVVGEPPIL